MSTTEYTKVYYGNFILVSRVKEELEHVGIVPIIKDEGESQRLAGYASMNQGFQDLYDTGIINNQYSHTGVFYELNASFRMNLVHSEMLIHVLIHASSNSFKLL